MRLIIESCKTKQNKELIQDLIAQIDNWKQLINLAHVHGVFPLVYHALKRYTEFIPSHTILRMKSYNINIVKRNMLMSTELLKITKLFNTLDIKNISFKGPTLSQLAYKDINLRQYSDLDILIDEDNIYNIVELLLQNGYTSSSPITLLNNKTFCQLDNDFSIFTSKTNILIELHWRLFRKKIGKHKTFQEYHDNKTMVQISNAKIATLSLENLLVYLCIHGSKHAWERLEWVKDIDALISKEYANINWDITLAIAKEMDSQIAFLSSLNLSHFLFHTNLPDFLLEKVDTHKMNKLTVEALTFISNAENKEDSYNYYRKVMLFQTKLLNTKTKQLKYILNAYFSITRNDYIAFPLPKDLTFLYYFFKPFRVVYKAFSQTK